MPAGSSGRNGFGCGDADVQVSGASGCYLTMTRKQKQDIPLEPAVSTELDWRAGKQVTELVSSPWTRSPGRMYFRKLLTKSIARGAAQPNYRFAVLYIDLDRFKIVNDSLGREASDQLLLEVARRLRSCLRPEDVITRLREDEYLIFLDDIRHLSNAKEFVGRLREVLRRPFIFGKQEIFVSAGVGIAMGPGAYSLAEEVVRDAEAAMHRAKRNGPDSHEFFDPTIHEEANHLLKLEAQLRAAIDQDQLELRYEPILNLGNDRIAGFEALLRWQHPERGLIYPGEFLPVADETGLIIPITQWVLRTACRQLKQWQDQYPDFASLWLSINLSPIYIERCDFANEMVAEIAETGVNAANLVIEITESQLLEKAEYLFRGLGILQNTGMKVWIDDFGSGYSSFAYLVNFPIHSLKIDQSFIAKLLEDPKSTAIVKAIVALGKTLGVNVIAEGVETSEQLEYLRAVECPHAQGHCFSTAIDAAAVEAIFKVRQASRTG